ncbi:MAG: hypothetical protein NTY98_01560 [Verrucomicrobia bacterium]|nr:hypothetical protein [Verrucomicrobiota bacterium]
MKHERAHQMTFEEKFARTINPHQDIHEPFLWFQELHLMRRLGAGLNDETRIRSFKFQRGLNILWAEPEDPEVTAGLYRDGIAGHSTGKTLFCRILRYLLAEPNFGTDDLCKHVTESFKELWSIASIRLNGKTWIVGRCLAGLGADFAVEGGALESVWSEDPAPGGFELFQSALENECGSPLSKIHPSEAWRHLIPWIARDQEARFSNITAWRDSLSEADNPRTSATAQHLIMRAVLRLLDPGEYDNRQEISTTEDQIKGWQAELPLKQSSVSAARRSLDRTLSKVPSVTVDLANLITAQKHITGQRSIRQESLNHFQNQPESPEVQDARKKLQESLSAKAEADSRIKTLAKEIPAEKAQSDEQLLTIERIKTQGMRDGKRVADNYCPNSYIFAKNKGCVPKSPDDVNTSMVEIGELEAQAQQRATALQAKEAEKARLESQADQLAAAIATKSAALNAAIARHPSPSARIQKEITILETAESEIDDVLKATKAESDLAKKVSDGQGKILKLKTGLATLKEDAEKRLKPFSAMYADVIQAVLGTSVSASTELGERGLTPTVRRIRELGGAALETIKTLAFDLAAVVHSMEGKGDHPRFLIHDGPREADMARVIYERFFIYARRMEECSPPEAAAFQYILTTTTHPPSDMQEGTPWLLGDRLSGKTKEGRLLKADF